MSSESSEDTSTQSLHAKKKPSHKKKMKKKVKKHPKKKIEAKDLEE